MNYEYIIPLVPPTNNKYIGNGSKDKNFQYQTEKSIGQDMSIFFAIQNRLSR